MLTKLKSMDWILMLVVFFVFFLGLASIYGNSILNSDFTQFNKQIAAFLIGLFLLLIFALLDYRVFKDNPVVTILFYLGALMVLGIVLVLGISIRGSTSWFNLGKLNFEPSELAKLAIIIILAKYFSLRHVEIKQTVHIIVSGIYALIPFGLILFQPDLGSATIIFLIWLGIILISGIHIKHLVIIFLIFLILAGSAWFFYLKDYQKERILTFINPTSDPLGSSYNVTQSIIAIGSGQIFGKGLGRGTQSQLSFLPEQLTDFIFASIAEEFGFIGILFIFTAFLLIIIRILKIIRESNNNFAKLFCAGFLILIMSQFFINIGMNLGLVPVIGLSLPFVSYGGSHLVILMLGLGIIQSIRIRNKEIRSESSFTGEILEN